MNQLLSIIVGAVVALGGGVVTTLLAPWVARRWTKADRVEQEAKDRDAALREAVEGFLSEMWSADIELSITAMDDATAVEADDARKRLMVTQRMQQAEAHLALALSKDQQPIHDLALAYAQAVFERERRGEGNEIGLTPIRTEAITRFARWLSGDETPEQAKVAFDVWVAVNWSKSMVIGEGGYGPPAV